MKFTKEHEWLRVEGDLVVVGITEHAATQLGDVVFVEMPETETQVAEGDEVCVIESVKAASDILAPIDGEVADLQPSHHAVTIRSADGLEILMHIGLDTVGSGCRTASSRSSRRVRRAAAAGAWWRPRASTATARDGWRTSGASR